MSKLKCAVVGAGIYGEIHCDVLSRYERADLVTICDLNEKRAREVAARCGTSYTTDYKKVAADKKIKAVFIATPDFAHRDVTVAMLNAGKHVLVEKPLATRVDEAEEMVALANKKGVMLMTDFHNRFNPPMVVVKQRLDSGELGRVLMMHAKLSDKISVPVEWFSWSGRSGPEWFLFPHIVDLCCWLLCAWPKQVFGRGVKEVLPSKGVDCYDVVTGVLDFGGAHAVVETSWVMPEKWPSLVEFVTDIQTSAGKVRVDLTNTNVLVASDAKNYLEVPLYFGNTPVHDQRSGFFPLPIRHFVDCLLEKRQPVITAEDGLRNVRIIAAIMESVREGRVVEV